MHATATSRTADFVTTGLDDRSLRRLGASGVLVRVVRGVYLPSPVWEALSERERSVTRIVAVVERLTTKVTVSHWSAAAIWGFPVPDAWPRDVQVIDEKRATSNRIATLHRRPGRATGDEHVRWNDLWVTSPARTAVDLALISPFDVAVLVFDHVLASTGGDKSDLHAILLRSPSARRIRSATAALEFADGSSASPGESFSRVSMASRGLPAPELQKAFSDAQGLIGVVDFWWPLVGVVGEFDGAWKYSDPRFRQGRSAAGVVVDEKRREARLRAHPDVRDVVRWDYAVARDPDELARRLWAAGVPRLNPRLRPPRWS
ncbi:hypothetical protein [Frondihabitans peucedani]|uniref:Transcriptional regulator, AbiEi antitoxin, Type IV TA system n=1 Tax=Frondihabitans peucedani TaxID=598626 RepID=A0ABP8DY40_9MICO